MVTLANYSVTGKPIFLIKWSFSGSITNLCQQNFLSHFFLWKSYWKCLRKNDVKMLPLSIGNGSSSSDGIIQSHSAIYLLVTHPQLLLFPKGTPYNLLFFFPKVPFLRVHWDVTWLVDEILVEVTCVTTCESFKSHSWFIIFPFFGFSDHLSTCQDGNFISLVPG